MDCDGGRQVVVKLNTGEHKRRLEMPEHCRRVDTLRKFGFDVRTHACLQKVGWTVV